MLFYYTMVTEGGKNIQLSNVSIEHEVDWLQMAHFHAEWRKKFYDVIIPFITGA